MHDSEFYRGPEDWPQPADDSRTLNDAWSTTISLKKKPKKNTAKARKKMSESLAGATAAVVGIAVLAGALPGILPVCPLCDRVACEYYTDFYGFDYNPPSYGLTAAFDSVPTYTDDDDVYAMPGLCRDDKDYVYRVGTVAAEDNRRVLLRLEEDFFGRELYPASASSKTGWYNPNELSHCCYFIDINPGDAHSLCMVALVSGPKEASSNFISEHLAMHRPEIELNTPDMRTAIVPVEGVSNVELQIATNIPELDLQTLIDNVDLTIIAPYLTYPLGRTLQLQESNQVRRYYYDDRSDSFSQLYYVGEEAYWQNMALYHKRYGLYSQTAEDCEVHISDVNWDDVFTKWQELNDRAPRYGHEVHFPVLPVQSVTCNNITYLCYVSYVPYDPQGKQYQVCYYYIPDHERTVMLTQLSYLTEAELQQALQRQAPPDSQVSPLQHITLR